MKLKTLLILSISASFLFISQRTLTYSSSAPPTGYTGAPGENNCTSCHSGTPVKSGTDFNNVVLSTNRNNSKLEYIPDSVYKVTLSYTESGKSKFGFQITTLRDKDDTKIGTAKLLSSSTTSLGTGNVSGKSRQYVAHSSSGTSGSGKISWTYEWTAPSANEGDITFYTTVNSSNNNSSDNGDKIILRPFTLSPSSKLPSAKISAPTTACVGDTVDFTDASSNSPSAWQWTFSNSSPLNSKQQNPRVVFNKAGTFTVKLTVTNGIGKSEETTKTIKVNASPSADVDSSSVLSFCDGGSVTLTAKDGTAWSWSTGAKTDNITITKSGTYNVVVENSSGCKVTSKPLKVTVHPTQDMNVNMTSSNPLCEADSLKIAADKNAVEYYLNDNGKVIATFSKEKIAQRLAAGSYKLTVSGKDSKGCNTKVSSEINLTVAAQTAAPVVKCDKITSDGMEITWDDNAGLNGYEISTDGGTTWTSPNNGRTSEMISGLTFSTEIEALVRGLDKGVCTTTAVGKAVCKTKACFKVSYNVDVEEKICENDTLRLTLKDINLTKYGIAFNSKTYSSSNTFETIPSVGTYQVNVSIIDSLSPSCPSEDSSFVIEVNALPIPVISTVWSQIDGENHACIASGNVQLTGNTSEGGDVYASYGWTGDGITVNGALFEFDPTSAGSGAHTIHYVVVNKNGCTNSVAEDVTVDAEKALTFDFGSPSSLDVTFTSTSIGIVKGGYITWDFGDGNTDTGAIVMHSYAAKGSYDVKASTISPASACPEVDHVKTVDLTKLSVEGIAYGKVKVYPNPVREILTVDLTQFKADQLLLINSLGQVKYQNEMNLNGLLSLEMASLEQGVYILMIRQNDTMLHYSIIKN